MTRFLAATLLLLLVASPVHADAEADIQTMSDTFGEMNSLLLTARDDPGGTLPAIDALRATAAGFTPSDDCVLPMWAMQLIVFDAYRSAVEMFAAGETAKGQALATYAVKITGDADPATIALGCG